MNPPNEPDERPSQASSGSLSPGVKVGQGRFTLKKLLGQGGMGMVWLAYDEQLQELVALKFLPPEFRFDAAAIAALRRETTRSRKLSHPNIVRIHDLHQHENEVPFIAMEYVDGPTLHSLRFTRASETLPWTKLAPLTKQLCDALDYAHSERIIHRDLKPSNLMLDGNGRLKLADFGISNVVSDTVSRISGTTAGTPAYMSPQQVDGKGPQATDDVYSLGATLYELLTGTPPFYTGQIVHQVLNKEAPPPTERLAELGQQNEIPPDVEAMIMACLAKDPARRPQSALAVSDWIGFQPTLHPKSLEATITPPEDELLASRDVTTSRNGLWVGVAVLLLLTLGAAGWFWSARKKRAKVQAIPPLAAQNATERIVFADDFENEPVPSPWNWEGYGEGHIGKSVVAENGNHFARLITQNFNKSSDVILTLPLQPDWKRLRFSYRIRTQNFTVPPGSINTGADLFIVFGDEKMKWLPGGGTPLVRLDHDTNWNNRTFTWKVSAEAKFVTLILSVSQASGIADFDNIKVTVVEEGAPTSAQKTNAAPARPGATVATVETVAPERILLVEDFEHGRPRAAAPQPFLGDGVVVVEKGNHLLQVTGNDIHQTRESYAILSLPPEWRVIGASAQIQARDLKIKSDWEYSGAKIEVDLLDERKSVIHYTGSAPLKQDSGWVHAKAQVYSTNTPAPARYARVALRLDQAAGVAGFDDLKVTVAETLPRAEAFHRQALTTARKAWPDQPGRWEIDATALAEVLRREGKPAEAEQLFNELLSPAIMKLAQSTGLLLSRSEFFARQGQGKAVATDAATNAPRVVFSDDFESDGKDGKPSPWDWGDHLGKRVVLDNTNHCARLEGKAPVNWTNGISVPLSLPLQPEWQALRFSCRFRIQHLKTNLAYQWSGADLTIAWVDEAGNTVDATSLVRLKADQNWKTTRQTVRIPARARSARLSLTLDYATGIADFDNVRVEMVGERLPKAVEPHR